MDALGVLSLVDVMVLCRYQVIEARLQKEAEELKRLSWIKSFSLDQYGKNVDTKVIELEAMVATKDTMVDQLKKTIEERELKECKSIMHDLKDVVAKKEASVEQLTEDVKECNSELQNCKEIGATKEERLPRLTNELEESSSKVLTLTEVNTKWETLAQHHGIRVAVYSDDCSCFSMNHCSVHLTN